MWSFPIHGPSSTCRLVSAALAAGSLALAGPAAAQTRPPIPGVTSTFVLEGTVDAEYAGADALIVTSVDGVKHAFRVAKGLFVHGEKSEGLEGLNGLRKGSTVAVHYTTEGGSVSAQEIDRLDGDGLKTAEGVVVKIDRSRNEIAVRFGARDTETFSLTPHAAHHVGRDLDDVTGPPMMVTVYYHDQNGRKVAHFFKKTR